SNIHTLGIGFGGHCIPLYPYFLFANPEDRDFPTQSADNHLRLPHYARHINDAMAEYAVELIEAAIGSLNGQSVLILGVAYRGNVRETAFSSARLIQKALLERGASVFVDDPLFSSSELSSSGYTTLRAELEDEIRVIILQSN